LDFIKILERGEAVQVVDVRSPQRVASGRIHLVPAEHFHNIVGSRLIGITDLGSLGMDPAVPVVVVCGHGNDSKFGAMHLNRLGAHARSLTGGMASWMTLTVPRQLPLPRGIDHMVQFDRVGKGSLGYLIVSSGRAMIIDPPRDPGPFLDLMKKSGGTLDSVADTHVHADYISGAPALARELGVPYYLHPADNVYPYDDSPGRLDIRPLHDGMSIPLGSATIGVAHTPGHSPGSVTFILGSESAFTGDFLFVGSLGRPDIADKTEEWSRLLWRSVQSARRDWPADMVVYPAHYSSGNERGNGGAVCAKFGDILTRNAALQFPDEAGFVEWIKQNEARVPAAYRTIKGINVGLWSAGERESDELESGKNECALGTS
jgi:glyoxylase-like metal-dependent hydrolase (beta-lactamase superfamily II)